MSSFDWSVDWNYENLTKLIELYRGQTALWDPTHGDYHIKTKKSDAWTIIANEMACEVVEVKSKMTSLLSSYRREKMKTKRSAGPGKGGEKVYKSKWFGYKFFDFLSDREPLNIRNTRSRLKKLGSNLKRKDNSFSISDCVNETTYNECTTFGEYVTTKLQKLDEEHRSFLMHRINNLMFEAEMELYSQQHNDDNSTSSSESYNSDVTPNFNNGQAESPAPSLFPSLQIDHEPTEVSATNSL